MDERRLLAGMAGVVITVLCALGLQIIVEARPPLSATVHGSRG